MSTVSPYLTRRLRTLEEALVQRGEAPGEEAPSSSRRDPASVHAIATGQRAERDAERESQP